MTKHSSVPGQFEPANLLTAFRFCSPMDVVRDPALMAHEKRAILADWASDARAIESLPTYRQLEDGTLAPVSEIIEALNALDGCGTEPPATASGSSFFRVLRPRLRNRREDDDDDPPPVPAVMPRPEPQSGGGVLCAA